MGMKQEELIYLDNAATTYPKPEQVYRVMEEAGRKLAVNAGRGSYSLARKASALIEETRERIKNLAGAGEAARTIFTPSATLACNLVLGGLEWKREDTVYVTPYEHNAVMRVLYHLQKRYGFQVEELPVIPGTLQMDLEKIKFRFGKNPPAVLVMTHVSNVTGMVIPWEKICRLAREYDPVTVIDGSQALGLVPVKLQETLADFYIFAGHKTLYGPLGIGGYINNREKRLNTVIAGGTGSDSLNLEMDLETITGYEPGSQNIVAAAGLHAAVGELLDLGQQESGKEFAEAVPCQESGKESGKTGECQESGQGVGIVVRLLEHEQELGRYLLKGLGKIPGIRLYQMPDQCRTGIVIFNLEGYRAEELGLILDEDYNIAVRTGYHCAPLIHKYLNDQEYGGVVRASAGRFNTKEELDRLISAVEEIALG